MFDWPTLTYLIIALLIVTYVLFSIWVLIRGWFDLIHMLEELGRDRVDLTDDGRVSHLSDVTHE